MSAMSGVDMALWYVAPDTPAPIEDSRELRTRDIKGKVLGVPVWELLGGKVRDSVPVYSWIGGDDPSDVLEQAKARKAEGFTRVKMNATGNIAWLDSPSALQETVERVKLVRSIGMDVGL